MWKSSSSIPDSRCNSTYLAESSDTEYKYVGGFVFGTPVQNSWFSTGDVNSLLWPKTLDAGQQTSSTYGSVSSYGAKAWTKFRPGESMADLAVFVGELTDLPRMLKTTANWFSREYISRFGRNPKRYAKVAADNWLNIQFGWLPFVSDLRKFYRAWRTMDKWYDNLVRHNGQWHKRGGTVKKEETEGLIADYPNGPLIAPNFGSYTWWTPSQPRGTSRITRVSRQRVWFEGSYRYYVPEIRSVEWRRKAIAHLFGADVNPATLWELTPFSWLVDWCTNVGDVLNASASTSLFANLATRYAYLMGSLEEIVKAETFFPFKGQLMKAAWEVTLSRKQRKAGGKFGFDLSDSSLTARQWSILTALGISRL